MNRAEPGRALTCGQCGTANAPGDRFCGRCGMILDAVIQRGEPATTLTSSAAERIRCPTCGSANLAGRTFCQNCGGKLLAATMGSRMSPTSQPGASAFPVGPPIEPPAGTSTPRRREPVERTSGIPGWLSIAGAGVLAGAIIVIVVLLLGSGSEPPPTSASSAPSANASASAAPAPAGARFGGMGVARYGQAERR